MSKETSVKKSTTTTEEKKEVKRVLKGEQEIHHDLFRLENAITRKNISFKATPELMPIEHKHFYHTINSDGAPQDKCAPSAGHYHYVRVEEVDGQLVATCSPPKTMRMRNGVRVEVDYENDQHTHNVTYLQSELVTRRVFSKDALEAINRIENDHKLRMANPSL